MAVSSALDDCTLDGFLDNQFEVYQPAKGAHRSGLDAILLAATVPQSFEGALCDLGAGCGVAGLAALHRTNAGVGVMVENDPHAADLVRQSMTLSKTLPLASRVEVLEADITLAGANRQAAGLADNMFDHVITNPPYNSDAHQRSSSSQKAHAHHASPELFEHWFKTACAILKPGGKLSVILRPEGLEILLASLQGRFGSIRILPLQPKDGAEATRILVGASRGGKAPLSILPPLVLHAADGSFMPQVDAALRGRSGISLWPS